MVAEGHWLIEYMPEDLRMQTAWVNCFQWAAMQPKIMDAFAVALQGANIETGTTEQFARAYAAWFNVNIWSKLDEHTIERGLSVASLHETIGNANAEKVPSEG